MLCRDTIEDKARVCLLSDSGKNELKIQYLMDYSHFSDKRRLFFNFVQKFIPNFKNCNSERQFLDLLSTDNEIILKKLVQFIYNNFGKRSPFLDKLDLN